MRCIEGWYIKWPWWTPNPVFKVMAFLKLNILPTKLLRNSNRKPYTIYQMLPLSMTLSDLWPRFQGHDIFWSRISWKWRVLKTKLLILHNRKQYLIYTVSQIKTPMRTIVHNFVKFLPIFTIFWLADSAGNL